MEKVEDTISANIRSWRKDRGLTQDQLAEKAGMSMKGLQKIENGHRWPGPDTLRALAKALDLPSETMLFSRAFPMPKQKPSFEDALEVVATAIARVQALSQPQKDLLDLFGRLDQTQVSVLLDHARTFASSSNNESAQDRLKRKQAR